MQAVKVTVQIHCPARESNGTKYDGMWRASHKWPVGKSTKDLIVVRRKDLPEVSDDQRHAQVESLHKQGAILDIDYQELVEDPILSVLVLKHERTEFNFVTEARKNAEKKLAIESMFADAPAEKADDKPAVEVGKPGNYRR